MSKFNQVKEILVDFNTNTFVKKIITQPQPDTPGYQEKKELIELELRKLGEDVAKATQDFNLYEQKRIWNLVHEMVTVNRDFYEFSDNGTITFKSAAFNLERLTPILKGAASYLNTEQNNALLDGLSGKNVSSNDIEQVAEINTEIRNMKLPLKMLVSEQKNVMHLVDTFKKNYDINNEEHLKKLTHDFCKIIVEEVKDFKGLQRACWEILRDAITDSDHKMVNFRKRTVIIAAEQIPGMPSRSDMINWIVDNNSLFTPTKTIELYDKLNEELKQFVRIKNEVESPIKDIIDSFKEKNDFSKEALNTLGSDLSKSIINNNILDKDHVVIWRTAARMLENYTHPNLLADIADGAVNNLNFNQRQDLIGAFKKQPLAKTIAAKAASIEEKYYKPIEIEKSVVGILHTFQESGYINPTAFKELGNNLAKAIEQVDAKKQEELWTKVHQSIIGYKSTASHVFDNVIEGAKPYIINGTLDKDAMVYGISGIMTLLENKNTLKMR